MTGLSPPALVGRDAQLRALLGAITRPPAVALVQGEAGIGKTRLVRAAVELLPDGERTVLLGHCHQLREPFPYGPVFDALRHVAAALPARSALNPVTGALRGYLPELAGDLPRRRFRRRWTTRAPNGTGCSAPSTRYWRPPGRSCWWWRTCTGPMTERGTCCGSSPTSRPPDWRWW